MFHGTEDCSRERSACSRPPGAVCVNHKEKNERCSKRKWKVSCSYLTCRHISGHNPNFVNHKEKVEKHCLFTCVLRILVNSSDVFLRAFHTVPSTSEHHVFVSNFGVGPEVCLVDESLLCVCSLEMLRTVLLVLRTPPTPERNILYDQLRILSEAVRVGSGFVLGGWMGLPTGVALTFLRPRIRE